MPRVRLAEATPGSPPIAVDHGPGNRFEVELITPGWGSSGFYSAEVLEAAAGANVFPAGMHMYLDHPSASESVDRPERSVRDLAAVLATDATWNGEALVAEADVFGSYGALLAQMSEHIGVSIRAAAEVTEGGQAEGRRGRVIDELVEGISADFVTRAGRGGRIAQVLEAARPSLVVESAVAHGVSEATANDRREHLQDALRDAYGTGEDVWVWVRDFDDTTVWYEHETPEGETSGTFAHTYTPDEGDTTVTLTGTPTEVAVRTTYVPVTPAGQTPEENHMPQIEESELTRLRESDARVATAEAARDAAVTAQEETVEERDRARRDLAVERARTSTRVQVAARVREANANLPDATVERIVEATTRDLPLTEGGAVDTEALNTAVDNARTAEESYLAAVNPTAGTPRGFGQRGDGTAEESAFPGLAGIVTESGGDLDADAQKMINERAGLAQKEG